MGKHLMDPGVGRHKPRHAAKKKPVLCRLGIHTSTFTDTTGQLVGPVIIPETRERCNACLEVLK